MALLQLSLLTIYSSSSPLSLVNKQINDLATFPSVNKSHSGFNVKCCISRKDFPHYFKFGASTSAFQTESAASDGGRGPSTWDVFLRDEPATDSLNKYNSDLLCVKYMNLDVYRFSISWPRLFPTGKVKDGPNPEGVKFYNNLIDEMILNGIEPYATIFHEDMPQALQDAYNGFLSREIVYDFNEYADFCFKTFGDRIKNWCTINEPLIWCELGYNREMHGQADATTDVYIVSHNMLLAHAAVVENYRRNYQSRQHGEIGITLNSSWFEPLTSEPINIDAARRAWDFAVGWYMEPLVQGEYPKIMEEIVGNRLPRFTNAEKEKLRGAFDFFGFNYYSGRYVKGYPILLDNPPVSYAEDQFLKTLKEKDGLPIGPLAEGNTWLYVYPPGLYKSLMMFKSEYGNPKVHIMENGYVDKRDDSIPIEDALQDDRRIDYIEKHLNMVHKAIREGGNVHSYLVWSLIDVNEFSSATSRFGLCYTDYNNKFNRIPKKSANWYKKFLETREIHDAARDDELGTQNHTSTIVSSNDNIPIPISQLPLVPNSN